MSGHAELDADFILQHSGFIRSLARGLLRDESLVDDVVQETLIKALEKGPRSEGALTAWLRTVTRNIAYKSYRGTARRRAREEEAAQPERLTATVDIVARGEALESLTASVMELPEGAREVIFLRYYEGLSHGEIAQQLELEPGAVRMRLHRAQKLLHERLDRKAGGDRVAWMSGLAGLAGIGLKDIGRGAHPAAGVAPVSGTAIALAATAALCLGAGTLFWLGTRPGDGGEGNALLRRAALAAADPADSIETIDSPPGERTAREEVKVAVPMMALTGAATAAAASGEPDDLVFPDGNVKGTVVDHEGRPVVDARVFAAWGRLPMELRTRTNERGRFGIEVPAAVLHDAEEGLYSVLLAATSEGSAPTRVHAWPREGLDDALGGKHALLRMRGSGGALEGEVLGADGRPVVGAEIRLGERNRLGVGFLGQQSAMTENPLAPKLATIVDRQGVAMFQGHRSMRGTLGPQALEADGVRSRLVPATTRTSKADGSFRFGGLELGSQKIRITAPGYAPYNGTIRVTQGEPSRKVFRLDRGATIRGTLTRSDGLPPTMGLVHAFHQNPYTVQTVRMGPDATFEIHGLPRGETRIVAEERWPRVPSAERLASRTVDLSPGEDLTLNLEMHEPALASVRVLKRSQGELVPAENVEIEIRPVGNPLDRVAVFELNGEGRAKLPLEAVRPVQWVIARKMTTNRTPSGIELKISEAMQSTPVRRVLPPTREEAAEEIVFVLEDRELLIAPVFMRPSLAGFRPFDHTDGVALFQPDEPFTYMGWSSGKPGVLQFNGVPTGDYHIIYPHHGLGWISSFTVHVGATALDTPQDLGTIELPRLGHLVLQPAVDGGRAKEDTAWTDLDIKVVVPGRSGTAEIAVFLGRAEIPGRIPVSPGLYALRHPDAPELAAQYIEVKAGEHVEVLWR
ncbi:ECF RNA polymerase sigma factor SigW [Planctomycetes bacterium Poly30]|uniref:ECF RNA polymerase sigma factor SigW n=1 Tax=Saltatorellus ferox TaxID=2528018 RepID=A0A518EWQ1_9BACT|nr:ECF RNA polymerase sigma factor SigW [Planctomycetes bacterium Poly30]